ncbi:unnamed protein product [Dicrocoelium dendriticum]|nr:unnamed protein product [Dicrocoelium dendriticum]
MPHNCMELKPRFLVLVTAILLLVEMPCYTRTHRLSPSEERIADAVYSRLRTAESDNADEEDGFRSRFPDKRAVRLMRLG